MVSRTTKSQVLPQQDPEAVEQVHYTTPTAARRTYGNNGLERLADVFRALVGLIPFIILAGSVVWAVVQLIRGVPDWWVTLPLGLFAAMMSVPVSVPVLVLLYGIIWLLCFGGVCELTNRAIVAGRSVTCLPPIPSFDDTTGSCVMVCVTVFFNTITWFMVFNVFFVSNGGTYSFDPYDLFLLPFVLHSILTFFVSNGGTYSLDPDGPPMVLVIFLLPFVLISISTMLFCLFGGPLHHLAYYLLCCCCPCCPSAAGTHTTVETEITNLEKEDDDDEATVATCGLSEEEGGCITIAIGLQ